MFASEYWTLKEVFNDEIKPRRNPLILLENKFVPCEMELFKNMLCFNPLTRIHAFSALKTNYFRSQSLEIEDDNEMNDYQSKKCNEEKIKNIKNYIKMLYLKSDLKPFTPLKVNISYPKAAVEGYDFNSHIRNLVVEASPITFKKDERKEEVKPSWLIECSGEKFFESNKGYRDYNLYYNEMDSDSSENSNSSDVDMNSDSSSSNNNSPESYDDNKTMVNDSPLNSEINQLNEKKTLHDNSSSSENEKSSLDGSENLNNAFFENTMNSSIYYNIINQLKDNFEESNKPNEENCNPLESIQLNFDLINMVYNSNNYENHSKLNAFDNKNSNDNEVFPSVKDINSCNNSDEKINDDIFNNFNSLINKSEINNILKHNYSNINEVNQDNNSLENRISEIDEMSIINKFRNYCKNGNEETSFQKIAITNDLENLNNSVEAINNDLIQNCDLSENINFQNLINDNEQFATVNLVGINLNTEIKNENLPLTNDLYTANETTTVKDSILLDKPKESCNILMNNTNNLCENEILSHKRKLYLDQEGCLSCNLEENNNTLSMKRKRSNKVILQHEY
ncbi:hypothetical protein LY90DRAFT_669404 [Neocallimastix californiae]|uniref:Uncharacterized protein n=1 Tax=Neocallimastix californiae TaxID=1754190 RepID=A0A1Y2DAD3_9FUNG|nr:hypothetical protein LY90DRAFT_669404 [Neocallimastix californiae]|eukprot:ORY56219.1 hypothetical protein LY90DRAFT_669404 [Neocallimastix californiae]